MMGIEPLARPRGGKILVPDHPNFHYITMYQGWIACVIIIAS
jgi:hypothetical protein